MHLYNKSEELVKEIEKQMQQEENSHFRQEYQTLLQQLKNISGALKSLGQQNQSSQQSQTQTQSQQNSTMEFGSEFNFDKERETQLNKEQEKSNTKNQDKNNK